MKSVRKRGAFLIVLGLLLLPGSQSAQEGPLTTWDLMEHNGLAGTLPVKSLEITRQLPDRTYAYRGKLSISAFCGINDGKTSSELAGQLTITWSPDSRLKVERLAGKDEDRPMEYPWQHVSGVRIRFDKGGPLERNRGTAITLEPREYFPVPEGATKVTSVEIDFYPSEIKQDEKGNTVWEKHTAKWDERETTASCYWLTNKNLTVSLAVDDKLRTARGDQLRGPVREIEKQIDEQQREIDTRRDQLAMIREELTNTSEALDAAEDAMDKALGVLSSSFQDKLNFEIGAKQKAIEKLERWKQASSNTAGDGPGRSTTPEDWEFASGALSKAKEDLAMLKSSSPALNLATLDIQDPPSEFDRAAKQLTDAGAKVRELLPKHDEEYTASQLIDDEITGKVMRLGELNAQLAQKRSELYSQASPSIEQIDVSVDGAQVLEAIFDPAAAQRVESVRDVNERVAAEQKVLEQALEDKQNAKKAFFAEADTALAAGGKLGGWTGAIMLNAFSHTASDLLDVGLAARKGGLYGVLAETLNKAGEFAVAYVSSGGEDVGYEGVDEAKIEEQARQGAPAFLNKIPLTIQELKQNAPAAIDWGTQWGEGKAEDWAKGKGIEKCMEGIPKAVISAQFPVPKKPGFNASVKAERQRLSAILADLEKPEPNPRKAFIIEKAITIGEAVGKFAAKKYEESLWRTYFEHDIQSRVLFNVYRGFNEIYFQELDRYLALQNEQAGLLSQQQCSDVGPYRLDKSALPASDKERNVIVSVKTRNVDTSALGVEVQHKTARFAKPNRFEGALAAGYPADGQLHVSVGSKQE